MSINTGGVLVKLQRTLNIQFQTSVSTDKRQKFGPFSAVLGFEPGVTRIGDRGDTRWATDGSCLEEGRASL
jgi:hypothetical protein